MRPLRFLVSPLVIGFTFSILLAQSPDKPNSLAVGAVVSGRVVSRGKPVAGALITLWQGFSEPTPSTTIATGKTDNNGDYELAAVPPGNYFMLATAGGFVTGNENNTIVNIRRVTVVGTSAIDPINFDLIPEGVIKGTVTTLMVSPSPWRRSRYFRNRLPWAILTIRETFVLMLKDNTGLVACLRENIESPLVIIRWATPRCSDG